MMRTRSNPIRFPMVGQTVIVDGVKAVVKAVFPMCGAIETTRGRFYAWELSTRTVGYVVARKPIGTDTEWTEELINYVMAIPCVVQLKKSEFDKMWNDVCFIKAYPTVMGQRCNSEEYRKYWVLHIARKGCPKTPVNLTELFNTHF